MVNKKIKKIQKKEKAKRKSKKVIEDIFEDAKDKATEDEMIEASEPEEKQKNNISFNFSVKMNKDGLVGNVSANGLNEEQKEVFENMMRNSLHNMNRMNTRNAVYLPNPRFRGPQPYRTRRFNPSRVNPCDHFWE